MGRKRTRSRVLARLGVVLIVGPFLLVLVGVAFAALLGTDEQTETYNSPGMDTDDIEGMAWGAWDRLRLRCTGARGVAPPHRECDLVGVVEVG